MKLSLLILFFCVSLSLQGGFKIYTKSYSVEIQELDILQRPNAQALTQNGDAEIEITQPLATKFNKMPQILVAITAIKMNTNAIQNINFNIAVQAQSLNAFSLSVSKIQNAIFSNLVVKYLAIDNEDAFIGRGYFYFSQNAGNQGAFRQAKCAIYYSRQTISSNWERKISAFITGYSATRQANFPQQLSLTIQIEVNYFNDSFELVFTSYDPTTQLTILRITYTYIEYYQDTTEDYYQMQLVQERQFSLFSKSPCYLDGSSTSEIIIAPKQVKVDMIEGIFYGINALSVSGPASVSLIKPDLQTGTFTFSYSTSQNSKINAISSDILVFTQQKCQANVNTQIYCDTQRQCLSGLLNNQEVDYLGRSRFVCSTCDATCQTCSGVAPNNCLTCFNNNFLYKGTCSQVQPPNTHCQNQSNQCSTCTPNLATNSLSTCKTCNSNQNVCLSCENSQFLYKGACYTNQPPKTFCDGSNQCEDCYDTCLTCTGSSNGQCLSCLASYSLQNGNFCTCPSSEYYYKEIRNTCLLDTNPFTKEDVDTLKGYISWGSTGAQGASFILTLSSGFSMSSSSLLSTVLIIQKIFYLQLINSDIPYFLFEFINAFASNQILDGYQTEIFQYFQCFAFKLILFVVLFSSQEKGITGKFGPLNLISSMFGDNSTESIGNKFLKISFPASVLQNCGGGLVLTVIILVAQGLISLLLKTKIKGFFLSIYKNLLVYYMFQVIQLMVLVFYFSFAVQITAFFISDYSPYSGFSYFMVAVCLAIPCVIIFFEIRILLQPVRYRKAGNFLQNLIQEKIFFNCIQDSLLSRSYLVIYTIIECILFPTIIIYSRSNFAPAVILSVILQSCEFLLTLRLRPFLSKIDNFGYIFEQFLWVITFILFSVLTFQIKNTDPAHPKSPSITHLSLVVFFLIAIIIVISMIIQITQFFFLVKNFISRKRMPSVEDPLLTPGQIRNALSPEKSKDLKLDQDYSIEMVNKDNDYL